MCVCVCVGVCSERGRESRSAGYVLCVLWVMLAAVLGGGVPWGGKHIIIGGEGFIVSTCYRLHIQTLGVEKL